MQLDDINDLVVSVEEGSNDASISFTIPSTVDGGNEIEIPTWSSDKVRLYFMLTETASPQTEFPHSLH